MAESKAPAQALIALGGNLGDVAASFEQALAMIEALPGTRLVLRSSIYRTPAWGVTDQPAFLNAVVAISTALAPRDLLTRLQDIERRLGRDRGGEVRFGPRPIDLDILTYDDLTIREPDLTVPHPGLFERAFVLVPLAEIAPDHEIMGVRIRDALARLDTRGIEKVPAGAPSVRHLPRRDPRHGPCTDG